MSSDKISQRFSSAISKFTVPGLYTFLHRINTFGIKIQPVLKNSWYWFYKVENVKSWYCENNYNLQKHFFLHFIIFVKRSIVDVWQGSGYALSSEYAKSLNILEFWIYLNDSWISLIMPKYVWIWGIWMNMPTSAWMACNVLSAWTCSYLFPQNL